MPKPRSLWPREHGAYVQLGVPLVVALSVGLAPAPILLAAAACLAFLANEPLLVMLGHRGRRLQASDGERARRRVIVMALGAGIAGIAGLALAPPETLTIAAIVGVPALALVAIAWRRAERTVIGETIAAVTLSGAAAPVAVAAGLSPRGALLMWSAWALGYATTVFAVHRVIERNKRPASWLDDLGVCVLVGVVFASFTANRAPYAAITGPLALLSTLLVIVAPRATHLRAIGFTLFAAAVVAGGLAMTVLH